MPENAYLPHGWVRSPAGWWCSRDIGHDGPCAAAPLRCQCGHLGSEHHVVPCTRCDCTDFSAAESGPSPQEPDQ